MIFIAVVFFNVTSFGQETKSVVTRFDNSQLILESYFVLKSDGQTKHGAYTSYSREGNGFERLLKEGRYDNGIKIGIWKTYKEHGKVIERFDHSSNKKLPTLIRVNAEYPKSATEQGLEGVVILSFQTHKDCSVSNVCRM
jgi:outer membrane biosynthesis protein TonB